MAFELPWFLCDPAVCVDVKGLMEKEEEVDDVEKYDSYETLP